MTVLQRLIAFVAVLGLIATAAYLPAMRLGWVWDDVDLVRPSPAIVDLGGLARAISTDLYRQANPRLEPSPYWRPLALASFWLDTRFGLAPRALHVGNVLLHALATALLATVLLCQSRPVAQGSPSRVAWLTALMPAGIAATWWALHPENVEAVAWISCRYDLLCGVALLGLVALPSGPGVGRAAVHGLLFLAGLLSKDGFAPMIAVVLTMDWAERRAPAAAAPRWIAIGLALALWGIARAQLPAPGFGLASPSTLIAPFLEAVYIYLARAIVPPALTTGQPYSPGALGIAIGVLILVGLAVSVFRLRRLAVPVVIVLAGLVPAAVSMPKYALAPERYFYVPSIGLALLVGELVRASLASERTSVRLVPIAIGLVTLVGLVRLELRLPEWRSDDALFAAALRVNATDPQANLQAGIAAGQRGDWGEARRMLEVAARGDPRSGRIASAYAWVLLRSGDAAGAAAQAESATKLLPSLPDAWFYLARARHLGNNHAGELAALEKLLQLSPEFPGALDAFVMAAREADSPGGDLANGGGETQRAETSEPSTPQTWIELARARHLANDHAAELAALDKALQIAPDFPGAFGARIVAANEVLLDRGDIAGAIAQAQRATELAPSLPEAWSVLAFARHVAGDHTGELAAIDRLIQIAPDFPGIGRVRAMAACEASGRTDCSAGAQP